MSEFPTAAKTALLRTPDEIIKVKYTFIAPSVTRVIKGKAHVEPWTIALPDVDPNEDAEEPSNFDDNESYEPEHLKGVRICEICKCRIPKGDTLKKRLRNYSRISSSARNRNGF